MKTSLLFYLCFLSFCLHAQTTSKYAVEKNLLTTDLFSLAENQKQASDFVTKATFLNLDKNRLRQLMLARPATLTLVLPQADKQNLVVELEQHQIVTDNFKVDTPEGETIVELGLYYKGYVQGHKESLASLSVFDDMVIGMLILEGTTYELGHIGQDIFPASTSYIFYNTQDMLVEIGKLECLTEDSKLSSSQVDFDEAAQAAALAKVVKFYIESDYDTYLNKGSNTQNVTNYITGFFNQVATLYANESINVQISELFIWTMQDPYTGFIFGQPIDGSGASLSVFVPRMQSRGFDGNIAQLIQMVSQGNDGLAFVDELCDNNPYAYCDVVSSYNQYPTYSWTVQAFTHEAGHVMGSPHTTECVWGPSNNMRLEACPGVGGCTIVSPPVTQTIMNPGCVIPDFTKGFGTQPGNLIRSRVAAATCLDEALPLDLLAFQGEILEKGNKLFWVTAAERNTKWHIIERSSDSGKSFSEIGRLPAAEFSMSELRYEWIDQQPLLIGFYRLRTVDLDGTEQFSPILRLERKSYSSTLGLTNVFPNPAEDWLQVQVQSPKAQQVELRMTDVAGKVIQLYTYDIAEGLTTLQLTTTNLAEGLYFLELISGTSTHQLQQVVISR